MKGHPLQGSPDRMIAEIFSNPGPHCQAFNFVLSPHITACPFFLIKMVIPFGLVCLSIPLHVFGIPKRSVFAWHSTIAPAGVYQVSTVVNFRLSCMKMGACRIENMLHNNTGTLRGFKLAKLTPVTFILRVRVAERMLQRFVPRDRPFGNRRLSVRRCLTWRSWRASYSRSWLRRARGRRGSDRPCVHSGRSGGGIRRARRSLSRSSTGAFRGVRRTPHPGDPWSDVAFA